MEYGYKKFLYMCILYNNVSRDRGENTRMHNMHHRYLRHIVAFHAWSDEFVMRDIVTSCYRTTGHVTSAHWVISRIRRTRGELYFNTYEQDITRCRRKEGGGKERRGGGRRKRERFWWCYAGNGVVLSVTPGGFLSYA